MQPFARKIVVPAGAVLPPIATGDTLTGQQLAQTFTAEAAVADKSNALDDALATLEDVRKTSAADAAAVREEADAKLSESEGEAVLEAEDLRRQIHELEGKIDAQSGKLMTAEDALETMRSSHALELAGPAPPAPRPSPPVPP